MPGFGPQASVRSRYFSCKIFKAPAGGEVVAMKFADESGAAAAKTARKNQGAAQHGLREGETGKQVESPVPREIFLPRIGRLSLRPARGFTLISSGSAATIREIRGKKM